MSRELDFDDGFSTATPSSAIPLLASEVTNLPTGNLTATEVQAALNELQSDIDTRSTSVSLAAHEAATVVHGATGAVVGTTNVQTLTNKTLTTPAISAPTGIVKADVGLALVDNTSDVTKNAATATLTNKTLTTPVITSPTGIVKADVGLGLVDNTSDATKNAAVVVLTNKDIDGGTASNTSRFTLPKATKTTLDALTRKQGTLLFDTTSGKPYYDDGTALQLVGSGSGGGVNFVTNPDAESGTTGWTVDSFAAAARPSGALTGVATGVTLTASSTVPLAGSNSFILTKDAVSRQGRVVYTGITITPAYFAKVVQITADYLVNSGTFVAGSTTTDSDVIFYLQNVSDGTFIEPSSFKLLSNSTTIADRFSATFQTSATATSYRLLMYVASVSAVAYSLKLDNISVSPSVYVFGTPITDWASFTPTGSWTTNTTYIGRSKRVGDTFDFDVELQLAGAPNNVALTLNLPAGFTIDTTKVSEAVQFNKVFGVGYYRDVSVALNGTPFSIVYDTITTVRFVSSAGDFSSTSPAPWAIGDRINAIFSVPVLGASSSVQMSDSVDTRVVAAAYNNPTSAITGTSAVIMFGTRDQDTHTFYNSTTGVGTILVSGYYKIHGRILVGGTFALNNTVDLDVRKNSVDSKRTVNYAGGAVSQLSTSADATIFFNAGDTFDFRSRSGATTPTYAGAGAYNYFTIERIAGPQAITASELIASSAFKSTAQSIPNSTPTVVTGYDTPAINTHGSFNSTTGVFTVRDAGIYEVIANAQFAGNGTGYRFNQINKNGALYQYGNFMNAVSADGTQVIAMAPVQCIAGDTISQSAFQSSGAALDIRALAGATSIHIKRLK